MACSILVIDDNQKICETLSENFSREGYRCSHATESTAAFSILEKNCIDVVVLDIRLGVENGLEVLSRIKERYADQAVVMITAFGDIDSAVKSMKLGAFDYLQKPVKFERLLETIENAASQTRIKKISGDDFSGVESKTEEMLSNVPCMRQLFERARQFAKTDLPVLLIGESGTGKELFTDFIHKNSQVARNQLIKINCSAFAESLLDAELFGHEKGAFTGADREFKGVFERADGGSLVLDEIGDMPPSIQAKILRTLQNNEIRRVGGNKTIKVKVRFIASTNKNLEQLITEKNFREDLYYRLNTVTLKLPPLRERRGDIQCLATYLLKHAALGGDKPEKILSEDAMKLLLEYDWPGNIRELKNILNYAAALTERTVIEVRDLPPAFLNKISAPSDLNIRYKMEKDLIIEILEKYNFNKKKTAEELNMSRKTLYAKMEKYEITC